MRSHKANYIQKEGKSQAVALCGHKKAKVFSKALEHVTCKNCLKMMK